MTDVHTHAAYQEGMLSYKKNKGRYVNPYPQGTDEHDIFERGWTQALKRTPTSDHDAIGSQQHVEQTSNKRKANDVEMEKAAYLRCKGR